MRNEKSRLAIIHLAKKQLGLDDETYRAILSGAGVGSAKEITTDSEFNIVMECFERLGFKSSGGGKLHKYRNDVPGGNPGMISKRQEYYIRGLWALASRAKDEKSLRRMVKRIGKVDDISFLSRRNARAVILALRDICWKAGINPDTKEDKYARDSKRGGAGIAHEYSSGVLPPLDGIHRGGESR